MATVSFTPNLERHVECPTRSVGGDSVRAVLDAVFAETPRLRGYVLDDQGGLRRHMMVFVDDQQIQDRHALVQCRRAPRVFWAQHHNGIFRSTDDMATWTEIREAGPSTFGFAVAVDPEDPDTAWFVPAQKDEKRVPVGGRRVVTRTRDGGATCETLSQGLPDRFAFDLVYRHALALGGGAAGNTTLAFGSTTGNVFASADRGQSWSAVTHHLPPVHAVAFAG